VGSVGVDEVVPFVTRFRVVSASFSKNEESFGFAKADFCISLFKP
jgi:hypothetical protein